MKIVLLTSHPIQHQAPLFEKLAKVDGLDLTVYFCWDYGIKEKIDPSFQRKIKWDLPLLEGYKYKFLKNYSLKSSSGFWGQINPGIIPELFQRSIAKKYDAVIIFGWNSFTNWLAFLTAFVMKIPVFLRGENPLNQEFLKPKWKIKIKKIILGRLFKQISGFLYIGEENKKFYRYYGVPLPKLFFCPYADDNERYISAAENLKPQKRRLKNELGINSEKTVILFVGKFIRKKRPFDLLKAYEIVVKNQKQKDKELALVFVGDGPLRSEVEKCAENRKLKNVYFVGFKNLTELPRYYGLSDILVLPSEAGETWGLVVNIAMCFKMPAIVSDMAGCGPDLISHNKNGYIFHLGDINELSQQLNDLIENSQKRATFGKKSFVVVQNYSYKKDVEGIIAALKK